MTSSIQLRRSVQTKGGHDFLATRSFITKTDTADVLRLLISHNGKRSVDVCANGNRSVVRLRIGCVDMITEKSCLVEWLAYSVRLRSSSLL